MSLRAVPPNRQLCEMQSDAEAPGTSRHAALARLKRLRSDFHSLLAQKARVVGARVLRMIRVCNDRYPGGVARAEGGAGVGPGGHALHRAAGHGQEPPVRLLERDVMCWQALIHERCL